MNEQTDFSVPVLYVIMRNDLPSLNMGKGMAQSTHVGQEFVAHVERTLVDKVIEKSFKDNIGNLYDKWRDTRAFGTTIVLAADKKFINETLGFVPDTIHGLVTDPSYPMDIPLEAAQYLKTLVPLVKDTTEDWPDEFPERGFDIVLKNNQRDSVTTLSGGGQPYFEYETGTLLRPELVGAYIFGDKYNGHLMNMLKGLSLL